MGIHSPQENRLTNERIDALINEYFDRRQAGEELTPESFAGEHPDLAQELLPYLEGVALLDRIPATSVDTAEGKETNGRDLPTIRGYELLKELGRGGMGVVYKALQAGTKRIVALKIMVAGPFASAPARRRFEREVVLAARLQHPNIVRVLESGETGGQRYYAMDYVAGVPLNQHLPASRRDVRATLGLFVQICEAVHYAHGHGVVHRDLKPGNILIDEVGKPHILDFGLAKETDQPDVREASATRISLPGQVVGTLHYLSPEQAAGNVDAVDTRTDVYAVGVMLFEALTGSLPLDMTGRPSEALRRILESTPVRPSLLSTQVDRDLETIILKALEKDQSRRYQSAKELADDIRRYLEGEPILARPPSNLYVLRKKVLKHCWVAAFCAAVAAAGLVALGVHIASRRHELADARREVLSLQQTIDRGVPTASLIGRAERLAGRVSELPEVHLVLAQAYFRTPNLTAEGLDYLERLSRQDVPQWAVRALLAEMYDRRGDPQRAAQLEVSTGGDKHDTANDWYVRSFATLDLEKALRCAERCVARDPRHALAWERLARLCLQTDRFDRALEAAQRIADLGRDVVSWTTFRGNVLARMGRYRQAAEEHSRSIRAKPKEAIPYRHRADVYLCMGEHAKAVADYTAAIRIRGEGKLNVWNYYQRATPLWILGRADAAAADLDRVRVLRGEPSYADARRYLILSEQGRHTQARTALEAARKEVGDRWLSKILDCLAGAITPGQLVADAAGRNNPEQLCEAYYYAGEVALLVGEAEQACDWFRACMSMGLVFDPDYFPVTPMNEFILARARLDARCRGPTAAPTPDLQEN